MPETMTSGTESSQLLIRQMKEANKKKEEEDQRAAGIYFKV